MKRTGAESAATVLLYDTDEVDFLGNSADYTFIRNSDGSVTVTDTVGTDGTDTLVNIESVSFQGDQFTSLLEDMAGQYGTSGADG